MANYPTMIIVRDVNDVPISAKCSECGEKIPQCRPWVTSKELNLKWFADQFSVHKSQKHSSGVVN
jgi:hypothetical protein